MTDINKNLNEEQKKAVSLLEGPVLILAGPGTGKTQLLSVRAANIMTKKNLPGENMLVLTYTNSAAKAVKERLAAIIGFRGYEIIAETFHGFANSVILDSEEAVSYIKERIQMTDVERVKALEYILDNSENIKELRPFGSPYIYRGEITKRISELKNEGISPEEFSKLINKFNLKETEDSVIKEKHLLRLKELAIIYKKYEEIKQGTDKNIFDERGRYDYDDMILLATETLRKESELKKAYQEKYKYIMIDEFQDTNGAQLKLLFQLVDAKKPNVCCVGDDDQSIYRFQGASRANFKILEKKFPDISLIKLKKNYRSTKEILGTSERIIAQIPQKERLDDKKMLTPTVQFKKKNIEATSFSTEDEEIIYIVRKIKALKKEIESTVSLSEEERKKPYNNIAILLRKRVLILKLIDAFLKQGISYTTDGKENIAKEKRVRQLINILRLANPKAESGDRDILLYNILVSDYFAIPNGDLLMLIDYVNTKRRDHRRKGDYQDISLLSEFSRLFPVDFDNEPEGSDTKKLPVLKDVSFEKPHNLHLASWAVARLLKDVDSRPVHDVLMQFIQDAKMYKFILKEYEDRRLMRIRDIRSLSSFVNMIKNYSLSNPSLTVSDYLEELDLLERHSMPLTGELVTYSQDGVNVITAHASKGLEFHTVIIPFCLQDKNWPLKRMTDKIPLPAFVMNMREEAHTKTEKDRLSFYDETRLFYVAASRAKANLIFTSSPSEQALASSFFSNMKIPINQFKGSEEELINEFFIGKEKTDPVECSKDILKVMVKELILTPTKLNTYLRCKRQFLYNSVFLLPGRNKQSLVYGNAVHRALEEVYREFRKSKKFPQFNYFRQWFVADLKYQAIDLAMRKRCEEKLPFLEKWFRKTGSNAVMPIDLEKNKIITLEGGVKFKGKFDKVEFEDESKKLIRVIDYKTGIPDKHIKSIVNVKSVKDEECDGYLRQLVAYKMLYERDTYESSPYKVSHGVLVFIEPVKASVRRYELVKGEYVDKKVLITDKMVSEMEDLIGGVWKGINNLEFDKFPEKDRNICSSCDFSSICWEE
ncbi:MAG: ATP-dependent helicase [Candidatus Omnitrophica bacterium]|nr:ATP-dependent helicase [Candidatus Omnitrophota bacterium]